ncbi:MAG: T9SS type A sorting domain-containing protein [Ignavibacteriales bacterium]|nr:T9SS type A sorting domain-containing protein [Ignavibacteriales bacterium]
MRECSAKAAMTGLFILTILAAPHGYGQIIVGTVGEVTAAIANAQPGNVIVLRAGTYNDLTMIMSKSGAAGSPITLKGETTGSVYLTGKSSATIVGNYWHVTGLFFRNIGSSVNVLTIAGDDNRFSCCSIDMTGATSTGNVLRPVKINAGAERNRFDHNEMFGQTVGGYAVDILVASSIPSYTLLDHNYFHDNSLVGDYIKVGLSAQALYNASVTVEYNLFENNAGGSIEFITNKSCNNTYRYNSFINCTGSNISLRHGHNTTLLGNFFDGKNGLGNKGIRVGGHDNVIVNNYVVNSEGGINLYMGNESSGGDYYQVLNNRISFNTLVNNGENLHIGERSSNTDIPKNNTIANNVFYSQTGGTAILRSCNDSGTTWEGNICFAGGSASIGYNPGTGTVVANPNLKINSFGVYVPDASLSTALINCAVGNYPEAAKDIWNVTREVLKDVGCIEALGHENSIRPLLSSEVGPLSGTTGNCDRPVPVKTFDINQNFPNPFNPSTEISYSVPEAGNVRLSIYDISGQEIETLVDGYRNSGTHTIAWNAATGPGKQIASGAYLARVTAGKYTKAIKLILLK